MMPPLNKHTKQTGTSQYTTLIKMKDIVTVGLTVLCVIGIAVTASLTWGTGGTIGVALA